MTSDLISGTLQLAPIGPHEWQVSFFPSVDIPRGTNSAMKRERVVAYLVELGIETSEIKKIQNYDFGRPDLAPVEFVLNQIERDVLRRLGLVADQYRR